MRLEHMTLAVVVSISLISSPSAALDLLAPIRRVLQTNSFLSAQPQANAGGQNSNSLLAQTGLPLCLYTFRQGIPFMVRLAS